MDLGSAFLIPTDIFVFLSFLCFLAFPVCCQITVDAPAMFILRETLNDTESIGWLGSDPCEWKHVQCNSENRVVRIQIGDQKLTGSIPAELNNLTALQRFEVMRNEFVGPLPSLPALNSLQILLLNSNNFTSIPPDFFAGMSGLEAVDLSYNQFSEWVIPESLRNAAGLQNFSATGANVSGRIPDFFYTFQGMIELHLAFNGLEGELPGSLSNSQIQSLWLNNYKITSKLSGSIRVLQNMTNLREVWLHGNHFSGPIPDLSGLTELWSLSLRDNDFTGVLPQSLINLKSLQVLNLTNNLLQGPTPKFDTNKVNVDMIKEANSFCLDVPNAPCDFRVNVLLSIAESMDYPRVFAENWKGNDPCAAWYGITCAGGNISVINFQKMSLNGTISSNLSMLTSLQIVILSNNSLTGTIPTELTTLPNLRELDVRNNQLHGEVPSFKNNVIVKTDGNPYMGKDIVIAPPPAEKDNSTVPASPGKGSISAPRPTGPPESATDSGGSDTSAIGKKGSNSKLTWGAAAGGLTAAVVLGVLGVCLCRRKTKLSSKVPSHNTLLVHPSHPGYDDAVKIKVAGSGGNWESNEIYSHTSSGLSDMRMVDSGNMVVTYQVLRNVTNNFSEENILGKGGFGTVYKGELHDGTKIAVKRMESGVMSEKGLTEFKSEIAVLTKVRHRHLVALLGYCLDGNERLLVYEYMPKGTLSSHLFNWNEEGLKSLEWKRRLIIALDVARGFEYLHGLAHQSFIHRDLKPSNILLGDDMRAKVADFGLVRLAPDGKGSIETRLAGTFGYLAPEYAATGRVTTKVDVFSFGVILMEMITGRKALDETRPEESVHLVAWFRRMQTNKDTFEKAIDPTIDLDSETLASINTVAALAGHCCAREPYQRPEMSHTVTVLSPLVELWKPAELDSEEDMYRIDLDMTLPQALKKWQASENNSNIDESSSSSVLTSSNNTQTSIPTRPSGFADSFTSGDGR